MATFTWRKNDDTQQWELVDKDDRVVAVIVYEELLIARDNLEAKRFLADRYGWDVVTEMLK